MYRKFNELSFLYDEHNTNWQKVYDCTDVNLAVETFNNIFTRIIDRHAPFKWVKCKGKRPAWVTDELLALIDNRTHCIRRFKKNRTAEHWQQKQHAIAVVNAMKKNLQREHVQSTLELCGQCP